MAAMLHGLVLKNVKENDFIVNDLLNKIATIPKNGG
jgi:hypothetical protein